MTEDEIKALIMETMMERLEIELSLDYDRLKPALRVRVGVRFDGRVIWSKEDGSSVDLAQLKGALE